MPETTLEERLNIAVITDPQGNLEFLRNAILKQPYSEFELSTNTKHQLKIDHLDAIFVIGNIVDPLFTAEEAKSLDRARDYLADELEHNPDRYKGLDVPGLAHFLKHHGQFERWQEKNKFIPIIEKLIGLKSNGAWVHPGVASERMLSQYRNIAKILETSEIPVFAAADTIFFERVIPEKYWLHWGEFMLGQPEGKQQLIKAVGMIGLEPKVPEYAVDPRLRGKESWTPEKFKTFESAFTITYDLTPDMHKQLKSIKRKIVIAGKRSLFDESAQPQTPERMTIDKPGLYYPGNLFLLQRPPCSISFYSFSGERGMRVEQFLKDKRLWRMPENNLNLTETPAQTKVRRKATQADAADYLVGLAQDIQRVLPTLEREDPDLAKRMHEAGFDTPKQIAIYLSWLDKQREGAQQELRDYKLPHGAFLGSLIARLGLTGFYERQKAKAYDELGITQGGIFAYKADNLFESRVMTRIKRTVAVLAGRARELEALRPHAQQLEERVAALEGEKQLYMVRSEAQDAKIRELDEKADGLEQQLAEQKTQYEAKLGDAKDYNERLEVLHDKEHAQSAKELKEKEAELATLTESHAEERRQLAQIHDKEIKDLIRNHVKDKTLYEEQLLKFSENPNALAEAQKAIDDLKKKSEEDIRDLELKLKRLSEESEHATQNVTSQLKTAKNLVTELDVHYARDLKNQQERSAEVADRYQREIAALKETIARLESPEAVKRLKEQYEQRIKAMGNAAQSHAADYEAKLAEKDVALENQCASYEGKLAQKDAEIARVQGEKPTLEQSIDAAASNGSSADAEKLGARAWKRAEKHDYRAGIELYTSALECAPAKDKELVAWLYANRGSAYFNAKDYAHALEDCTAALRLTPQDARVQEMRQEAERKFVATKE